MPVTFDDLIAQQQKMQPQRRLTSFEDLKPSFTERMQTGSAPLIPSATDDSFNILPMRKTGPNPGEWEWDASAGPIGVLLRLLTSGGDVARGAVPTPYGGPGASATPNPDTLSRAWDAAGVLASPSPSYMAGVRYGAPPGSIPTPSAGALVKEGGRQLDAVGTSGYEVPSSVLGDVSRSTREELIPKFLESGQAGQGAAQMTYGNLDRMADPKYSSTSIATLKGHYDALTGVIAGGGSDAKAASIARDKIADMINNLQNYGGRPQPGVTPTMSMEDVGKTFDAGRGNYRSGMGANRITGELNPAVEGILREVEAKHNVTGVSYNVDRQLRNRALAILEDNKNVATLLPDEKRMMEAVVNGSLTRNSLRNFGEMFGWSNPLRATGSITLGGATGGGLGISGASSSLSGGLLGGVAGAMALPTAGTVARMAGSGLTKRALMATEALMRRNSPLMAEQIRAAPIVTPPAIGRDMLMQQLYRGILEPALEGERQARGIPQGQPLIPRAYGPVI